MQDEFQCIHEEFTRDSMYKVNLNISYLNNCFFSQKEKTQSKTSTTT